MCILCAHVKAFARSTETRGPYVARSASVQSQGHSLVCCSLGFYFAECIWMLKRAQQQSACSTQSGTQRREFGSSAAICYDQ